MILVLFLHLDCVWVSCRGWLSLECLFDIFRVSSTIRPTLNHGSSYFPAAVTLLVLYSLAQLCSDWNRIRWLWRNSPDCKWHDRRGTRAVMVGLTVTVELLIIFMTVGQRPWFDRVVLMRLQVRQMDCMPWLWIVYSCRLRLSLWSISSFSHVCYLTARGLLDCEDCEKGERAGAYLSGSLIALFYILRHKVCSDCTGISGMVCGLCMDCWIAFVRSKWINCLTVGVI